MKSRTLTCVTAIVLFTTLATSIRLSAQQSRYRLIDIGTLGGPSAHGPGNGPGSRLLNDSGAVAGTADTPMPDPNAPNCANSDCFVSHAFRWQHGVLTDLGVFSGTNWSHGNAINARGWIAGTSTTGEIDPLNPCGFQPFCLQFHAALWNGSEIVDLGTLGGFGSDASYVNNGGQVIGSSTFNTTPDPFSFLGAQTHAFIWKNGVMRDLGTLGGPDSFASQGCNNQRSDSVAGGSFLNSTPNPATGFPTQHAFLWENGTMTDIPTLGGTFAGAQCANDQGQVIGQSNLAGDVEQHAFSWNHGALTDLGTLGGPFSQAIWLNNAGEAVGGSCTAECQLFHATLWKNGQITDLGTLDGDCFSVANAINSSGQIIGQSTSCDGTINRAVVWINGSIFDLNAVIPPNPTLQLVEPVNINDRGEIAGLGLPPGCDDADMCGHVFLLIPCDNADTQGCESKADLSARTASPAVTTSTTTPAQRREMTKVFVARLRSRLAKR